jgi:hypothetical protein
MLRLAARRSAAPLLQRRSASSTATPSLATQLVAYAQGRASAGASAEAEAVLEHGLTLASGADERACIHMASAAVAAGRGRFAAAAQQYEDAAKAATTHELSLAALCGAAAQHSAAGSADAALAAATRAEAVPAGAASARVAAAGARGLALHAAGRAAGEAYAPVLAAELPLSTAATEPHGASVAAALHGAAAWVHCSGGAADTSRRLLDAAAALSRDCAAAAASAPAPVLLSAHAAAEIEADAELALAQVALSSGDADAAERHCATALRLAEALAGASHPRVGLVLAVTADATMARLAASARGAKGGVLADSDGVYVAEALYRRAMQLMGTTQADKGEGSAALAALLQLRLSEVLRVAGPTRAPEAARLSQAGAAAGTGQAVARPWAKAADGAPRAMLSLRLRRLLTAPDA